MKIGESTQRKPRSSKKRTEGGDSTALADAEDRPRALGAEPQVAARQEEVGAVLLGGDRVLGWRPGGPRPPLTAEISNPPGARVVRACTSPGEREAGLLPRRRPISSNDASSPTTLPFFSDALHEAGAVAEVEEVDLPLRGPIVDPAAELDGGADVLAEVFDRDDGHGRCGHGLVVSRCAGRTVEEGGGEVRGTSRDPP